MVLSDRKDFDFEAKAKTAFAFLVEHDFIEIESSPTLVRYKKGHVEVDIYHGRQSYEVGLGVTLFGVRYSLSEIVRLEDSEVGQNFRYPTAATPEEVKFALGKISALMKNYGCSALDNDQKCFFLLKRQRESWAEDYALQVLAEQLRPQANDAFRKKKYAKAAELYSRILKQLSPAEIKKLRIAEKRSNT